MPAERENSACHAYLAAVSAQKLAIFNGGRALQVQQARLINGVRDKSLMGEIPHSSVPKDHVKLTNQ